MAFAVNPLAVIGIAWRRTILRSDAIRTIFLWAVASFVLNLAWEIAQLPLYTIPSAQTGAQVAYAVVHCTAGDVFIGVVSFLIAAALNRDVHWPASAPWLGGAAAILAGVSYSAYSEWYNVYQMGNWGYSADMPLVVGIGLTPLLQWIAIPLAGILAVRRFTNAGH